MIDYLSINRKAWNEKTEIHFSSEFYDMPSFLKGETSLNDIELELLGDLEGKSVLHLQCHFGQDSISLARLGAKVTAVDLSDVAIAKGKELAQQLDADVSFICSDIYDLEQHLDDQFDIVFTSYGTIGWLPDLSKWANIVDTFLNDKGKFVMVDFHPVVWMHDDNFEKIIYKYSNDGPIVEQIEGTYTNQDAEISTKTVGWNHGMAEIMSSLMNQGLALKHFDEIDYSPYPCFSGLIEIEPGKFQVESLKGRIPMLYSLVFLK